MENVNMASIVRGDKYHTDRINSCYEEFLRLKPIEGGIGDSFYIMLQDATISLIKSVTKSCDNSVLEDNTDLIVTLTEKYARIYFIMDKEERVLLMLRSIIYDIVSGYDRSNVKYDTLALNLYESIRRLITV